MTTVALTTATLALATPTLAFATGSDHPATSRAATFTAAANNDHPGIGRTATPAEIKAWNIDVRPDFQGLPKGSGTVAQGQEIWDGQCASCHGTFGESNQVFTPIVGGTTKEDMKTGHAKTLASATPAVTTLSKVSTISSLWDYIHRAMPWNATKSLTPDQVYAVLAYILNLGDIVPTDFTLSEANIKDVQKTLPNRNGMVRFDGLWKVHGTPDTHNVACMHDCADTVKVVSSFPDSALAASGDPAQQNRPFGAVRGIEIASASGAASGPSAGAAPASAISGTVKEAKETTGTKEAKGPRDLASQSGCMACHGLGNKIVGPGFNEVAAKYKGDATAKAKLVAKLYAGGAGVWGQVPMPPQQLSDGDANAIVKWILAGAKSE